MKVVQALGEVECRGGVANLMTPWTPGYQASVVINHLRPLWSHWRPRSVTCEKAMHSQYPNRTHSRVRFTTRVAAFAGLASLAPAGLATPPHASTASDHTSIECPSAQKLRPLLKLGNIYLGELHGTVESPNLVRCLTDAEVAAGAAPLFVSLELPEFARDTHNGAWGGVDGRTSQAMMSLVDYLESLEKQGKLTLDFQLTGKEQNAVQMNKQVGEHLRGLATKGRLIALGGNLHSQRKQAMIPSLTFAPAGAFVGDGIKTVMIVHARDGTAWNCTETCGAHKDKGFTGIKADELVDGSAYGHDYLYGLDQVTASPPARASDKPEASRPPR
jgi:hypothetical protein